MDEWSNKLPERLPFSKKRLPKRVIFSFVPHDSPRPHEKLTKADTLSTMSS